MRKFLLVVLCVLLVMTMVACGGKTENITDVAVDTAGNVIEDASKIVLEGKNTTTVLDLEEGTVDEYDNEAFESLAGQFELPFEEDLQFYVEAEDGSWNNALTLRSDGSMYGSYYELDKTLIGENYQNGTYYWNTYWGKFGEILWLDESSYSLTLNEVATEKEDGIERLEDDSFKSITTLNMKGISNGSEYILFAPGTPIHMLPENMEELLNKDLSNQDSLEMFVLLDTEQQIAFWAEMPR